MVPMTSVETIPVSSSDGRIQFMWHIIGGSWLYTYSMMLTNVFVWVNMSYKTE